MRVKLKQLKISCIRAVYIGFVLTGHTKIPSLFEWKLTQLTSKLAEEVANYARVVLRWFQREGLLPYFRPQKYFVSLFQA